MLAGDVVEMATGEGKTLSGAIAAAGYALAGRNVHVVTINDYLARRDAEWMGPLIEAMGLTVGWITSESTAAERRAAYQCDVTYASVNGSGSTYCATSWSPTRPTWCHPTPTSR